MTKRKKKGASSKPPKKKAWGSKQVLASPFAPVFPTPDPGTLEKVVGILLETFPEPFAKRVSRPSKKCPRDDAIMRDVDVVAASDGSENVPLVSAKTEDAKLKEGEQGILKIETSCKKPPRLLCGVNEVTRALEKGKVELAVVCRDVSPSIMVSHIPVLCFIGSTKLVILSGNGGDVGKIMGTQRLLAFGICKKEEADVGDDKHVGRSKNYIADRLVERLSPLATPLDFPWLAAALGGKVPKFPDPVMIPHRSKKDIP